MREEIEKNFQYSTFIINAAEVAMKTICLCSTKIANEQ